MSAPLKHPLDERAGKVRSASMRKLAHDGTSWTPTESRKRDQLMRQFVKGDGPRGNTDAYREAWERIFRGKE